MNNFLLFLMTFGLGTFGFFFILILLESKKTFVPQKPLPNLTPVPTTNDSPVVAAPKPSPAPLQISYDRFAFFWPYRQARLSLENFEFLMAKPWGLRHVTTHKHFIDNIRADEFQGDAIPLFTMYNLIPDQLEEKEYTVDFEMKNETLATSVFFNKSPTDIEPGVPLQNIINKEPQKYLCKFESLVKKFICHSIFGEDQWMLLIAPKEKEEKNIAEAACLLDKVMSSLSENKYKRTFFIFLEATDKKGDIFRPRHRESFDDFYPLGKFKPRTWAHEKVIGTVLLDYQARQQLIKLYRELKGDGASRVRIMGEVLLNMFYKKFCDFITSRRLSEESSAKSKILFSA